MPDGEVFRKESKRWVAPKTSYDGDDWGTDYDEYDNYNEYAEYAQNGARSPPAANPDVSQLNTIGEEDAGEAVVPLQRPEVVKPSVSQRRMSQKRKQVPQPQPIDDEDSAHKYAPPLTDSIAPLSHSKSNSVASADLPHLEGGVPSQQEASAEKPRESETTELNELDSQHQETGEPDMQTDGSLQDIYGFYETRYPQHPYSAMISGLSANQTTDDYSDSTASLSTGRRSLESGPQEGMINGREKFGSVDYQSELDKVPEVQGETEREPGTPEPSKNVEFASPEVPESPFVVKSVERLHIAKSPGHSRNTSLDDEEPQRPVSQIDPDIAEMYEGTSEFLNRPMSTYQLPSLSTREISDASIRDLLTPQLASSEFQVPNASGSEPGVPSLLVTQASPERQEATPNLKSADERFKYDHDYVDDAGDSDNEANDSGESDDGVMDDDDERDVKDEEASLKSEADASSTNTPVAEPFILPSERNRLQPSISASSAAGDLGSSSESHHDSRGTPASEISHDSESNDGLSGHTRGESQASAGSAATGATDSATSDGVRNSDVISTSNATGVTSGSDTVEQATAVEQGVMSSPENSMVRDIPEVAEKTPEDQGMQSIAAKVKRPPLVDFTALLNNSGGSSESRCEQLRLLRTREAEYSSGLVTWLTTTYSQVDKSVKVYANGVPSATQTTASHDTHTNIATAKVTSVVQSSASNTKEKLGKVGEKSKSFFAKVMR